MKGYGMNILKYEKISLPGKQINEDHASITSSSAWVLDGATGLGSNRIHEKSDAAWFVNQWNEYLLNHIHNHETSLKEIVRKGIKTIKNKYYQTVKQEVAPIDLPSSGIALIRFTHEIEYFLLGDCSLLIKENESVKKYKDDRLEILDNQVIHAIKALRKDKNLSLEEAREAVKDILIKNRLLKNKPDGYWILGFDEEAVNYAITGTLSKNSYLEVLMMTDGFSAIEDKYAYINENQLLDDVRQKGLEYLYNLLRDIENKDASGILYPRLKQSDDASAVYIQLNK